MSIPDIQIKIKPVLDKNGEQVIRSIKSADKAELVSNQKSSIKCQRQSCLRNAGMIEFANGKRKLTVKTRHNGEMHSQEIDLDKLIKENYTLEEISNLFRKL